MCLKHFKLLIEIVIVSSSGVIRSYVMRYERGQKAFSTLSLTPFLAFSQSSLSFSLAFSILLSIKLGELGQRGKSIITKRGVMTQMLKSRSLRAKLFSRIL